MRSGLIIGSAVFMAACASGKPADAPVNPPQSESPTAPAQAAYPPPETPSKVSDSGNSRSEPRTGPEMSTVPDRAPATAPATIPPEPQAEPPSRPDADNTGVNKRDRSGGALTPMDQGNGPADLSLTQQIRKAIMADASLSFMAKNVKVITQGGKVTLRGAVKSDQERKSIEDRALEVAGAGNVDNQIEVKK